LKRLKTNIEQTQVNKQITKSLNREIMKKSPCYISNSVAHKFGNAIFIPKAQYTTKAKKRPLDLTMVPIWRRATKGLDKALGTFMGRMPLCMSRK